MVSMEDVARRAGVSTATVSRVLNARGIVAPDTEQRVLSAVTSLKYVMSSTASSLASGRTKNVGVIVPDVSRWYFANIVRGIADGLRPLAHDLTIYNLGSEKEARQEIFEESLRRQRVDGFIAIAQEISQAETARLQALDKPIVGVGGHLEGVETLWIDDRLISATATQHLIDLGHQRIAHISGSVEFQVDFNLPVTRQTGYEDALRASGIPIRPEFIVAGDFTIPGGYRAAEALLALPEPPTAIFASSDETAVGAILAIRDAGLAEGRDISVVGVDGHELGEFFELTTIAQYPREQGIRAVELLMNKLTPTNDQVKAAPSAAAGEVPANAPLHTDLIIRHSSGPVPPTR